MKIHWQAAAIAVFASIVSYIYFSPFVHNFFTFDSFKYLENIYAGPKAVMLGYNAFRVVSNFMWYPLYFASGLDPAGYNIFNDFLFALNAFLLYVATLKLWEEKELSFLIALLFILNVTYSDAIFWQMSMSTLLCAALYFCTLITYIVYRKSGNIRYWFATLSLYTITMFTKEDAASFPFVVVLMEILYFDGLNDLKALLKRITPFIIIIACYIIVSNTVFHLLGVQPETAKFFKIRPLYSIFAGYSVFFLDPQGELSLISPYIYATALGAFVSLFLVKNKKIMLFGYAWIFVTFLPQSLSAIGQFQTKYIFNSISRLLYLPAVGASVVAAVLLLQLKRWFPPKAAWGCICIFISFFFWINYSRVQIRGNQWRDAGEPTKQFLNVMKQQIPDFPPNTYVFVTDPPTGRAYMQQALRVFYRNPTITWIADPLTFTPPPGSLALLLICNWQNDAGDLRIDIIPFNSALLSRI